MFSKTLLAQSLSGVVTDSSGNAISFVNVFIKGTQNGTKTNEKGYYELTLPQGSSEIVYQYIGYKSIVKRVEFLPKEQQLNITLFEEQYNLKELAVSATAEDPAYPIMRQVIAHRNLYANEVKESQSQVYMKSLQRLTTVPKRVLLFKIPEDIKPGIVYLSESVSELNYQHPDKIKEKVLSSKVSGSNKSFTFNRAGAVKFNLYQPVVPSYGLNQRGFFSPLANNAFQHYKFKLIGEEQDEKYTIYKIKLIPLKPNDAVFKGHIYVIKDLWRLQSTDLLLDKESEVEFVENLSVKQSYECVDGKVWMPVSQHFIFTFSLFGFKGNGYIVVLANKFKIKPAYADQFYNKKQLDIVADNPVPQVRNVKKVKLKPKQNDSSIFTKRFFNNEILRVEPNANKMNDSVWKTLRPIALTEEELTDYKEKDSFEVIENSKTYLDSIDRLNNKPDAAKLLVTGYVYQNSYKNYDISFTPLKDAVQFNTVEGWLFNQQIVYTKRFADDLKSVSLYPRIRYGFSSERFYGTFGSTYTYNKIKLLNFALEGGSMVYQFNQNEPITPFINTAYSLLAGQNYMKLYQSDFVKLQHNGEVINGFYQSVALQYANRSSLTNRTNYSWADNAINTYTANNPFNQELTNTNFNAHGIFSLSYSARIIFKQRYLNRPDGRFRYRSEWPVIYFNYKKAIPVLNTLANFDHVNVRLNQSIKLKMYGSLSYDVLLGTFFNNSNIYLMDLYHAGGNQTIFSSNGFKGFQLLDYYGYSTQNSYVNAQAEYHLNGLFLSRIPLIRNLKWQEVLTAKYYTAAGLPVFTEFSAGIEHIAKIIRVDFCMLQYNGENKAYGIRIGFGF